MVYLNFLFLVTLDLMFCLFPSVEIGYVLSGFSVGIDVFTFTTLNFFLRLHVY